MLLRAGFSLLLMLPVFTAYSQNDTYILRNMEYGKKVGPATPTRKRVPLVLAPSPVVPRGMGESSVNGVSPLAIWAAGKLNYPKGALRAGVEGRVSLLLSVSPDGHVTDVTFEHFINPDRSIIKGPTVPLGSPIAELIAEAARVYRNARFAPAAAASQEVVNCQFNIL